MNNTLSALSTLGVRTMSYSKRILKRMRGHPREWGPQEHAKAAANLADLAPSQLPVRSVQPLPSGWSPPLGASPTLPFRVRAMAVLLAGRPGVESAIFGRPCMMSPHDAYHCSSFYGPSASSLSPFFSFYPLLQVTRTALGQQIPVYSDLKNGQTRKLTVVRRVEGDTSALALELHRVTGGAKVQVRPGRVEIAGDRSKEVKQWLAGLGF